MYLYTSAKIEAKDFYSFNWTIISAELKKKKQLSLDTPAQSTPLRSSFNGEN